ncbi:MAG: DUF1707 domain-containing protein [Propionibacteriaceae bacterium]|nr:DUF1707 domain-containing protein [Propionibacteriaceae bacterium]
MTPEPVPQRLSDADRDAAATQLREHFEAGRLDASEFDERLTTALSARFASELTPLFADLPGPDPLPARQLGSSFLTTPPGSRPSTPAPAPAQGNTDWIGVARGVIWPAAILLALVTGNWWTFIVIAIIGSIILTQIAGNQRKPPPYLDGRRPPGIDS